MAIIHNTTMSPGKLDLLRYWLPAQPWYLTSGRGSELARAGGFRLDDPAGEVGIEFMVVTDGSGPGAVTYQVPLTYRAGTLAGAEGGLIGTAEHGCSGAGGSTTESVIRFWWPSWSRWSTVRLSHKPKVSATRRTPP
jgi:Maltokinase N-terminal cap domain